MANSITKAKAFLSTGIWEIDTRLLKRDKAFLVNLTRFVSIAGREYSQGQLNFRAMSFVYTTLLSIVPLLAATFSVLKAFGVHSMMEPLLLKAFAPLGESSGELVRRIVGFVGNMKVGVLGSVGIAMLMYTSLSLIGKMEDALNHTWRAKKARTFARRFSDYMSVLLVGPILIFAAIGLTGGAKSATVVQWLLSIGPLGFVFYVVSLVLPYLTTCAAFTLTYIFLPNVKVRFGAAVAGGLLAGIAWEVSGWAFASFVAASAQYSAVYSGLAIIVLFMMWTYYSWLIFLVGGMASFYWQNPNYLSPMSDASRLSGRLRERLMLAVMYLIGDSFHKGASPWTPDTLARRMGLPGGVVRELTGALKGNGLVIEAAGDSEDRALLPGRDTDTIPLLEVLDCARGSGDGPHLPGRLEAPVPELDGISRTLDDAFSAALAGRTVGDLVAEAGR